MVGAIASVFKLTMVVSLLDLKVIGFMLVASMSGSIFVRLTHGLPYGLKIL